jgi:chaperonin GroES
VLKARQLTRTDRIGTEVKLEGVEYLVMKESDIMGVIEQTAARKKAA